MATLRERREKQKRLFKQCLARFTTSPQFNHLLLSTLGDTGYHLEQYDQRYKHQSLQILSYQFSSMGGTNHAKILQLSVSDHYQALSHELDHLHKAGLGFVLLDKHNEVCMVSYDWDHTDMPPPFETTNAIYNKKLEICNAALLNDSVYQTHVVVSRGRQLEYGQVLYKDKGAMRPDLEGTGMLRTGIMLIPWLFTYMAGYEMVYAIATNNKTMLMGHVLSRMGTIAKTNWRAPKYFDFSDFEFRDGTSVQDCYRSLVGLGFDNDGLRIGHCRVAVRVGFVEPNTNSTLDDLISMHAQARKRIKRVMRSLKSKL